MIDPKELRCGDWMVCPKGLAEVKVMDSRTCDILTWPPKGSDWCGKASDLQPIPLTDALLEACGFEKDYPIYRVPHESLPHIEKNGDKQTKDYGKWLWFNKHGGMEVSIGASFQYLHQLQNLYFALTGKELEIDEEKLKRSVAIKPRQ